MNEKKLKGGIFNRVSDTNLLFIITVVIFFLNKIKYFNKLIL